MSIPDALTPEDIEKFLMAKNQQAIERIKKEVANGKC